MLLFNWNEILKRSKGNVMDTITILRIITFKLTPKNSTTECLNFMNTTTVVSRFS